MKFIEITYIFYLRYSVEIFYICYEWRI